MADPTGKRKYNDTLAFCHPDPQGPGPLVEGVGHEAAGNVTHFHPVRARAITAHATPTNFSDDTVYLHQSANDTALVSRTLEGDTAAFEVLVTHYQRVLFAVALRMLGDYEDARDVTQNTFIKAYQKLNTFDHQHRFFSWIYRILVNECLNAKRGRPVVQGLDAEMPDPAKPDEPLESAERRQKVRRAILDLPVEYREVIVLRHFTALSYLEIAEALSIPVRTVKSRLHTARQRLLQALSELEPR
jgi:RNA polymerase sigma-70 factor (ECF subfamily)